ncbi:MAG: helix-hairpin-helix domain-containing protein [Bacteroidetes bacterium]|jgi:hypothetical protein|nr:helix-hairpin-helix domain-containing protein [Bacteroidota bacterium]
MISRYSTSGVLRRLTLLPLVLGALLLVRPAAGQVPDTTVSEPDPEGLLEDLESTTGTPEQLAEALDELAASPLDINRASADALAQIPALGPSLARTIVAFRERFGAFGSIPELRSVEGITQNVYLAARPYLTIGETVTPAQEEASRFPTWPAWQFVREDTRYEILQRTTRRLDLGRGYEDDTTRTTYAGSPSRIYTRLRVRSRDYFSVNLTLEKDPGEAFTWTPDTGTYGYDHVAGHVAIGQRGRLQQLIVGDYVALFGQGVALWRSSAFGKGRAPVRPMARTTRGFVPYGSTDENRFFRGAAATVLLTPSLSASAFASRRTLDANVNVPDTTRGELFEDLAATSLSESGLHRTPSERADKDAVQEDVVGGGIDWQRGGLRVGVLGYRSHFDRPFQPGDAAYQRFRFSGTSATLLSGYANWFVGDAHLFGEVARSPDGVLGLLGGGTLRLNDLADLAVVARHFPRDFVSLHGYAFGERNGATQNETGFYLGLDLQPAERWSVVAYFDQYRFPWVRFSVPRPSTGYDALLAIEHRPRRWLHYYVQFRSETKEQGHPVAVAPGRELDGIRPETRQSLRLHGQYQFSRALRLRTRLEGIRFAAPEQPDEYGMILYQDVRWLPISSLQLDLRVALFDTDSYDARVYAYENDLLYTFSVPAFSGRGQRSYALLRWQPLDAVTLQVKYAVTRYENVDTVGSGLDEVDGNRLRELRAQLRLRW